MQPQRLTDSHCANGDPHRGFEIMKTVFVVPDRRNTRPSRWRIVNPEAGAVAVLMFSSGVIAGSDRAVASEDFSQNHTQKPITAVDNAMTTT